MPTRLSYMRWIHRIDQFSFPDVVDLLGIPFDEGAGFGFSDLDIFENNVAAKLIYSSVVQQRIFDVDTGRLVSSPLLMFNEVVFEIDYYRKIISINSGASKLTRLITILGQIAENKISFEPVTIGIDDLISALQTRLDGFELTGLIIKHYRPSPDLQGKFSAKVLSQHAGRELAEQYGQDITEFTANIEIDGNLVSLRASAQGAVAFRGNESSVVQCFNMIKDIAVEHTYA